ncbi:MAG: hypothetical protein ABJA94_02085 [Rhodoglobus sp.]
MIEPPDAALIVALEAQSRGLAAALNRLEVARRDLVPTGAAVWRGRARHAYDDAVQTISTKVDAGIAALRSARDRTDAALAGMADRG